MTWTQERRRRVFTLIRGRSYDDEPDLFDRVYNVMAYLRFREQRDPNDPDYFIRVKLYGGFRRTR